MRRRFHTDKIKAAAWCDPSSPFLPPPPAVANYLDLGCERPLKSEQEKNIHQCAVSSVTIWLNLRVCLPQWVVWTSSGGILIPV